MEPAGSPSSTGSIIERALFSSTRTRRGALRWSLVLHVIEDVVFVGLPSRLTISPGVVIFFGAIQKLVERIAVVCHIFHFTGWRAEVSEGFGSHSDRAVSGGRQTAGTLDVQESDVARVLLDELPFARLHLVAHESLATSSASAASSMLTCNSVRVAGSIVVSHSWSGSISPRPL